ncbi:MAG TPA: phosphatase PAP2 family protein [Trebonia sp.]|nr:phosphatase PAP2 family protein [Trebonia sp.]
MPRHARPDDQLTQPYTHRPRGQRTQPPPGGHVAAHRPGLAWLLTGAGLCVLVLVLGEVAKTGPVGRLDLRADEDLVHDRTGALTAVAKFFTTIATPETVGVGLLIALPVILWLLRRRLDAVRVLCMFAGAFALAEVGKKLINEHRPPISVQAMAADHTPSFPSGHATTAAVLAVSLVVIVTPLAWRAVVAVLGVLYAVAVAASRVYLGDHYPLDVLGSILCALAAAFVVAGLLALPAVQPYARRLTSRSGRGRGSGDHPIAD